MTYNVVKVARAPIMVCLQCPLCCNLVHEATTISECLHTFCRDCIYQRLGDGESDCCPICNVSLGCSPLEKLRADHQLDGVRAQIFPFNSKKRKVIESTADAPAPVRRKERSLSSLGIGAAPPSANPGFANRRTKSLSRRAVTIRDTSADEFEDGKLDGTSVDLKDSEAEKDFLETNNSTGTLQEADISEGKAGGASDERGEIFSAGKREFVSDEKRVTYEQESLQMRKGEHFVSSRTPQLRKASQDPPSRSLDCPKTSDSLSNLGMYLAERSKISATGLLRSQSPEASDQPISFPGKQKRIEHKGAENWKPPAPVPERRVRSGKNTKNRSTLAHLAEVAVDHAGGVESNQRHPIPHGPGAHAARSRRERGKSGNVKGRTSGDNILLPSTDEKLHTSASQLQPRLPPLGRSSTGLDKLPVIRKGSSGGTSSNVLSISRRDRSTSGLWFILQAAENQLADNALPQISTRYLRIKDGKLPVSIVKKYLVKKLDLKNESEVEITCRGQHVVPSLPLESIQGIWFATTTPTDILPSLNIVDGQSNDGTRLAPVGGTSAEGYMMVLTYGRNRRTVVSH